MSLNRVIAISIDPSIEIGALAAVESLKKAGLRSQLFITGDSPSAVIEKAILHDPSIQAVLEFSLGELVSTSLGIHPGSEPERLTSAAILGLPQVIIPGGLDHMIVHRMHAPAGSRKTHQINEVSTVFRTTPEDNDVFGKELAFIASASRGPVVIVFPRGGLSQWDGEGQPLHGDQANQALLDSLHLWKAPNVELVESHRHINDPLFAQIAVEQMLRLLAVRS